MAIVILLVYPIHQDLLSMEENMVSAQEKVFFLNLEYKLVKLGEDVAHVRNIMRLFRETKDLRMDEEDEWRTFIRVWDEGLGQDSHYNIILDAVCTADLKQAS